MKFDISSIIETYINDACTKYAKSQMDSDDWIKLVDANMIKTNEVVEFRKVPNMNNVAYTIRKSLSNKYDDFYEEKLIQIMERLTK